MCLKASEGVCTDRASDLVNQQLCAARMAGSNRVALRDTSCTGTGSLPLETKQKRSDESGFLWKRGLFTQSYLGIAAKSKQTKGSPSLLLRCAHLALLRKLFCKTEMSESWCLFQTSFSFCFSSAKFPPPPRRVCLRPTRLASCVFLRSKSMYKCISKWICHISRVLPTCWSDFLPFRAA